MKTYITMRKRNITFQIKILGSILRRETYMKWPFDRNLGEIKLIDPSQFNLIDYQFNQVCFCLFVCLFFWSRITTCVCILESIDIYSKPSITQMNKLRSSDLYCPLLFVHKLREFGAEVLWNTVKFEFCLAAGRFYLMNWITVDIAEQMQLAIEQHRGSVQFSSSVMSDYLRPHEFQHARPPCPSPTPRVYSNSRPLSRWCHPSISSSVVPFSSCPQSLPALESFPMSQRFAWGGQSTGVSALASFLPKNMQGWSPLEWTGWISLQSKGLSRVFSNITVQKHQFFGTQPSSQSNSYIHTWPLEKTWPWLDGPFWQSNVSAFEYLGWS